MTTVRPATASVRNRVSAAWAGRQAVPGRGGPLGQLRISELTAPAPSRRCSGESNPRRFWGSFPVRLVAQRQVAMAGAGERAWMLSRSAPKVILSSLGP